MATLSVQLENANRMMVSARALDEGLEFRFADGCLGIVPFTDLDEIRTVSDIEAIELPNAYEVVLKSRMGESVELPWDFVRHYCESSYRSRVEAIGQEGRHSIGSRLRALREGADLTQEALAQAAGIGRVTLSRVENGEQSPRYQTILALARALNREPGDLLVVN